MDNEPNNHGQVSQVLNKTFPINWLHGIDILQKEIDQSQERINDNNKSLFSSFSSAITHAREKLQSKKTLRESFFVKDKINFHSKREISNKVGNTVFRDSHHYLNLEDQRLQKREVERYITKSKVVNEYLSDRKHKNREVDQMIEEQIDLLKKV